MVEGIAMVLRLFNDYSSDMDDTFDKIDEYNPRKRPLQYYKKY